MPLHIAVIMDDLSTISYDKDSTIALILDMQRQGICVYVLQTTDLYLNKQTVCGHLRQIHINPQTRPWYHLGMREKKALSTIDCVLMRKDPPFDINYILTTHLLDLAEQQGTLVLNKPSSIRDANEKLMTAWFPSCCPPAVVSAKHDVITDFILQTGRVIIKPLDSMGGKGIFQTHSQDPNLHVILETATANGTRHIMAQAFIPEITQGDKRIILINGQPIPYALVRVPKAGDFRGNISAGASTHTQALSPQDQAICQHIGPTLQKKGLLFVGIDVIGPYLTEINVTSPTGIREIEHAENISITQLIIEMITTTLTQRKANSSMQMKESSVCF